MRMVDNDAIEIDQVSTKYWTYIWYPMNESPTKKSWNFMVYFKKPLIFPLQYVFPLPASLVGWGIVPTH